MPFSVFDILEHIPRYQRGRLVSITHALAKCLGGIGEEGGGRGRKAACERVLCIKYQGVTPPPTLFSLLTPPKHKIQRSYSWLLSKQRSCSTPGIPSLSSNPFSALATTSLSLLFPLPSPLPTPYFSFPILQLLRLLFVCFLLSSSSLSFRVIAFVCFCSPCTAYIPCSSLFLPLSPFFFLCLFSFLYFEQGAHYSYTKAKAKHGRSRTRILCVYTRVALFPCPLSACPYLPSVPVPLASLHPRLCHLSWTVTPLAQRLDTR